MIGKDNCLDEDEKFYFTAEKRRINFFKHFGKESYTDTIEVPYKAARYAKKVSMRNALDNLKLEDFMSS